MACGSKSVPGKWEDISSVGIVSSHAYSILSVHKIDHPDLGIERLVRLRNPWGKVEWSGDFSDDSDLWTDDLKDEVGFTDEEDGIFFMREEDYLHYFAISTICRAVDGHDHTSVRVEAAAGEEKYFKVNIENDL